MNQNFKFKLLYGGCFCYNKKDGSGKGFMVNLLEPNYEDNKVNSKTFVINESMYDKLIECPFVIFDKVMAGIEMSVTSNFTRLVSLEMCEEE